MAGPHGAVVVRELAKPPVGRFVDHGSSQLQRKQHLLRERREVTPPMHARLASPYHVKIETGEVLQGPAYANRMFPLDLLAWKRDFRQLRDCEAPGRCVSACKIGSDSKSVKSQIQLGFISDSEPSHVFIRLFAPRSGGPLC